MNINTIFHIKPAVNGWQGVRHSGEVVASGKFRQEVLKNTIYWARDNGIKANVIIENGEWTTNG